MTGLKAQQYPCEVFISSTQNGNTITSQGSYYVDGQLITEPALVDYVWTIQNNTLNGQMITNTFVDDGVYLICLTATGMGCTATVCDSIIIGDPQYCNLMVNYSIINATDNNTSDGSIDISVTGGTSPYSYVWADGQISEDISGLYPGVYTVAVNDSDQCSNTWSFYVMSNTIDSITNDTVFDSFYASAYYNFMTNDDCSATVYAEAYGGTAPYSYQWSNDVTAATIENACGEDFYCVTITDAEGQIAEACVFVQFYDYGQDTVWTVNDTLDVVINECIENVVNAEIIDYIIQGNTIIVNWEFIDDLNNIIAMTITYTLTENVGEGIYQIYLYFNCGDFKSLTGYSDQIIVTDNELTGIADITSEVSGQLYPNPVGDELNIELNTEKSDNITLEIYNYSGQIVYSENNNLNSGSNSLKLDASQLSSGVYFVRIIGNSNYETLRFVK